MLFSQILLKELCIKPGIQERGTECGEPGKWGECYVPGNVLKHSGKCLQTFRGCPQTFQVLSSNIPGNVAKHSGEFSRTFRGMLSNILGNTTKHSGECSRTLRGMSVLLKGMRTQDQSKISWNL